jgi:hypothetical protein
VPHVRRNGYYIEVEVIEGLEFIDGSIERGEFRFSQILEWIRRRIKKLP